MPDNKIVPNRAQSHRDYELGLLSWIVIEPINGRTDWYVKAAFSNKGDAERWAEHLNATDPGRTYDYEVNEIGTFAHPVVSEVVA